jgi:hypothetical protein
VHIAQLAAAPERGGSGANLGPGGCAMRWPGRGTRPASCVRAHVGFVASGAILADVGTGAVNMLMTLPAMRLIDVAGRRPLLLYGALGMCAAMIPR